MVPQLPLLPLLPGRGHGVDHQARVESRLTPRQMTDLQVVRGGPGEKPKRLTMREVSSWMDVHVDIFIQDWVINL